MFFITKAALEVLGEGCAENNTTSVAAYQGHPELIDDSASKGAIVSVTRSLALNLTPRKIMVNAVATGPIWTQLIPSTFGEEKVQNLGNSTALRQVGQPSQVALCYLFLATASSSFMTGQVLHPNGGRIVNG
jgi:NAD(P)-dependent dehydrogenase (short-subunit alcohol dehydrogenase family)